MRLRNSADRACRLSEGIQVYEQLGYGDGAYAFALSMHNICTFAACGYGTDAFKQEWARDLTSGRKLANFALTEPQSGSDPMKMYTRATINGDGTWTISGSKAWVSLATEADVYFTVVKTSDAPGHKDMAMIAIPADAPGLSFGPLYDTPSYTFLPMSEMYLDNVVVSEDNIILPIGQGLQGSLMAIDIARVSIASGCCGLMQAALDTALSYAKNRKMFGGKIPRSRRDPVDAGRGRDRSGGFKASLSQGRRGAWHPGGPLMAAHAKRFVPDAAVKAANTCTQVLGGMGLLQPYGLDRLSRLAQMLRIVDGTTEISRVVIGRALQKRAAGLARPAGAERVRGGADESSTCLDRRDGLIGPAAGPSPHPAARPATLPMRRIGKNCVTLEPGRIPMRCQPAPFEGNRSLWPA
jgi:alkylation response protein AidB-like acyl-CoA dehydrogenase